jgi:hypothetical protein
MSVNCVSPSKRGEEVEDRSFWFEKAPCTSCIQLSLYGHECCLVCQYGPDPSPLKEDLFCAV